MKAVILEVLREIDGGPFAIIPEERWFERSSIREVPTVVPFAVIAGAGTLPGMGRVHLYDLEIWFHDNPGSYDRINELIEDCILTFDGTYRTSALGYVQNFSFTAASTDLEDPDFRTICRSLTLRAVGRPLVA